MAETYVERLSSLDVEGIIELLDDEAVQEYPFASETPTKTGKVDLAEHYRLFPGSFSAAEMTITALWPHADPEWVSVEYEGSITALSGQIFENSYLCMFRVVDGRIRMIREFFVPVVPEKLFES